MQAGVFPEFLKIGRIAPVYKNKGSKQNFDLTIAQSRRFQFLQKSLKKSCTQDYI